ncbi:MAG TPA: hypothetical protein VLA72_19060 [Anaerolineales bacterium]|nr:hypothetical protein [Anaerolineales bacterium]
MKNILYFLFIAFFFNALVLGACTPASIEPISENVVKLPTEVVPVVLPTEPIVYAPQVTIAPTSGQTGTLVQVIANGFLPNTPVSVGMGPVNSEYVLVAQGITDANGHFIAQVPVQGAPGMDFVFSVAHDGQAGKTSNDQFHILDISHPTVAISPTSGESGTLVQVVASGFSPNEPVSVGMGPANSGFGLVAEGITDANGVFITNVTAQGSLGMQLVFAVSSENQPGVLSSQQFQITGAVPNPQPIPPTPTPYLDMWAPYTNTVFAVSLEYPSDWQPTPGYRSPETGEIRFGGVNGFFHINAMDTDSIDMAAASEANHKLQPYGTQPTIEKLQVQGQEARLILPSENQPTGMQYQAALIVHYPQPVNVLGTPVRFFVLWADQAHIRTFAQTIQFIQ